VFDVRLISANGDKNPGWGIMDHLGRSRKIGVINSRLQFSFTSLRVVEMQ